MESTIKGFILSVRKSKNEDSIALILTPTEVRAYYRFFGARHSILQLGNLIDFEVEEEGNRFLPRLRGLSHLGFPWLFDKNRLLLWHNFIQRFEPHLKDAQEVDSFYFDLLLTSAKKWDKQNPKRIVCEAYISMLSHEGRVHQDEACYICEMPIKEEEIALMQAFIPAHPNCIYATSLSKQKVFEFFQTHKTTHLEDDEVDHLFEIVMRGF
ncbi:MAG: hypothetical protein RL113_309 [Pseudomonadota bacterium]